MSTEKSNLVHHDRPSWILWYVITFHFILALLLAVSPEGLYTSNIAPFITLGRPLQISIFAWSAGLAAFGMREKGSGWWFAPQQTILWIVTISSLTAAWHGSFPDGTVRPGWFILADQLPHTLTSIFHAAALILRIKRA